MIEELRILCRDEAALIEERTALINQLRQALREYYPTALEAFDDWTAAYPWAFIERFPSADALIKAGKQQWETFLHTHKLARPQTCQARLEAFARASEWHVNAGMVKAKRLYAVAKARQLRADTHHRQHRDPPQEPNHPRLLGAPTPPPEPSQSPRTYANNFT